MKTMVSSIVVVLVLSFGVTLASEKPCGDWEPFKDEKCFKVFDTLGLQNFTDAEATCATHDGGKLLSITTKEEQEFLVNFLFKQKQVVDEIWLGAKVTGSVFHWEDGANLTFSNWASGEPKNQADHCAQMNPDGETAGKWVEEPCKKKNLVVCQKRQTLSLAHMQEILVKVEKELFSKEGMLFKVQSELVSNKKELVSKEKRLLQVENELVSKEKRLSHLEANPVPLGFLYTQYPKEKAPTDIWPSLTWTEVTSAYAGVFFRAEGAGADSFGEIQQENAPTIDTVEAQLCNDDSYGKCHLNSTSYTFSPSVSLPKTTGWSDYVGSHYGFYSGTGSYVPKILYRYHTTAGEVRPRNMAIKVWKRSA